MVSGEFQFSLLTFHCRTNCRLRKISGTKPGTARHCSYGLTAIERVSTSAPRSVIKPSLEIHVSKSREPDSAILRERQWTISFLWSISQAVNLLTSSHSPCSHVLQAAREPVELDEYQANAVAARIELDLRIGAAFTRLQTLQLQAVVAVLKEKVISYGRVCHS